MNRLVNRRIRLLLAVLTLAFGGLLVRATYAWRTHRGNLAFAATVALAAVATGFVVSHLT